MDKNNSNFTEQERNKLIKGEIKAFRANYKNMAEEKKKNVYSLIDEAAFLKVTLMDLRLTVNKEGTEIVYQNGANQWGKKKSPAFDNYLNGNKQYMAIVKQLDDMIPKQAEKTEDDSFDKFVGGRDD